MRFGILRLTMIKRLPRSRVGPDPSLRRSPIARFLLCFALLFGVLIAPWPGWNQIYGAYFRALNGAVFARENASRILRIEAAHHVRPPIDTVITMANPNRVGANGRMSARILWLDARSVGWVPTALILALTIASLVSWKRRAWAILWGWLLVQIFILVSVGCYIWNESAAIGLVTITPFWKPVAHGLEETLVTQLGASFVVPALIWLVVTFRSKDLHELPGLGRVEPTERPPREGRKNASASRLGSQPSDSTGGGGKTRSLSPPR